MTTKATAVNKVIFFSSIFILVYMLTGACLDIYRFKITGALYELFWLPVLLLFFICPVIAFVNWYKEKFSLKSLNFYSLILALISISIIIIRSNTLRK